MISASEELLTIFVFFLVLKGTILTSSPRMIFVLCFLQVAFFKLMRSYSIFSLQKQKNLKVCCVLINFFLHLFRWPYGLSSVSYKCGELHWFFWIFISMYFKFTIASFTLWVWMMQFTYSMSHTFFSIQLYEFWQKHSSV